jgi:hypothetical protein
MAPTWKSTFWFLPRIEPFSLVPLNNNFTHWVILVSLSLGRCLIHYTRLNNFEQYCTEEDR